MQNTNWRIPAIIGSTFGLGTIVGRLAVELFSNTAETVFINVASLIGLVIFLLLCSVAFILVARFTRPGELNTLVTTLSTEISLRWLTFGTLYGFLFAITEPLQEGATGGGTATIARLLGVILSVIVCFRLFRRPAE